MADVMKNDRVWDAPSTGSPKREEWPSHVFLDPEGRRYPYKKYVDGQWKISCTGLLAAYRRAITQQDSAIANKAKEIATQSECSWATGK